MSLETIAEVQGLLNSVEGSLIGVGITAFPRITPAYFQDSYQILSLKKTLDVPLLRKRVPVFSLEEELGEPVQEEGWTSARLLSHPASQRVLEGLRKPTYLLLYQGYEDLEAMALEKGWVLLANRASLRNQVGDRRFLQALLERLDLPVIPGGTYPTDDLRARSYGSWEKDLGPRFVIQLNEIRKGGGRGTFFIRSPEDYQVLLRRLEGNTWRGTKVSSMTVRRYISGIPASVALCLLRQGILVSGLQRQLIDLPYCKGLPESGIFCGHVWGDEAWPHHVVEEAQDQARRIAEYLSGIGYKGIAGIDYMVDEEDGTVYALEINPRLSGVFPMLSLLHMREGTCPHGDLSPP